MVQKNLDGGMEARSRAGIMDSRCQSMALLF